MIVYARGEMNRTTQYRRSKRLGRAARHRAVLAPAWLLVALMLTSACSGPRTPVAVGVKEYPSDVLLGIQASDVDDPAALVTEPNPLIQVVRRVEPGPPSTPPPGPRPVVEECPEAHPLSAPRVEAFNRATQPPVEGGYVFRNSGRVSSGHVVDVLPGELTRTIRDVQPPGADGVYRFEIVEHLGARTTTTSYAVIPEHEVEDLAGIYVTRTEVTEGDDTAAFNWNPPVKMMPFPASEGDEWSVASTASNGQTVLSFDARIGEATREEGPLSDLPLGEEEEDQDQPAVVNGKIRVDACGVFIQAWNIQVFNGRLISPTSDVSFEESYAFATQFGGLSVKDTRVAEGVVRGSEVASERESIINTEPELPDA